MMTKLPTEIDPLLKKFNRSLRRTVTEGSEEDVKKHREWAKRIAGGVGVVAKKDGKFVLVRHTPESWGSSHIYWAFPGGAVEHGEAFEEAAIREFKEETGLEVEISDLVSVHEHVLKSPKGERSVFYVAIFKGKVVGGEVKPAHPNEISEVKLFDKVPSEELVPWLRDALRHAWTIFYGHESSS